MMEEFKQFEIETHTFGGFISKDPEFKYNDNGSCVVKFSLPLKKKKDDEAVWLNCEAWQQLGEYIAEKFKKGDFINVTGRFKTSEYNGKTYTVFSVMFAG